LFRAVQIGTSGYEKHVQLFRSESLPAAAAQAVEEGLKKGLTVHNPQAARGFETGRIEKTAFAAYELFEGRSVGALMQRSQAERHPFAADHALLIVSKAAAALEGAQARKTIHGFLTPDFIHVSHDGEVTVRGFGLPPRILREAGRVGGREALFLAPEIEGVALLDIRADIFSLGAQLFEMLVGSPLPRPGSAAQSIQAARIPSPGGDGAPIPRPLAALLTQALADDPGERFKDASAFKKAVDTLLFSGDYSPTTFNLAFFMHTLFRDEGDEDASLIQAERQADYRLYVQGLALDGLGQAAPSAVASPSAPPVAGAGSRRPELSPDLGVERIVTEAVKAGAVRHDSGRIPRHAPTPKSPAADHLFETARAEPRSFPVIPAVIGIVVVAGFGGYFMTRGGSGPAAPAATAAPTMNPAEVAALARVKELESRLADLEAEKAAAEQRAAEEARKAIEAQARARGRAVDPEELQKAEEGARRKAQAEQEEYLISERKKIEEERRIAGEDRAAEAEKAASASPTPASSVASPTNAPTPATATPTPTAVPTPTPAATPSGPVLLDLDTPGVMPPELVSQARLQYPPAARVQRITGSVLVSALVDERGNVVEVKLIRGVAGNVGLNQAALENVKKRKYKPATQNGRPGRAWVAVQIDFKL